MMFNIRRASLKDVKTLNLLFQKLLEYERENYDKNIKDNLNVNSYFNKKLEEIDNIVLVAEVNKVIVGYLFGYIDKTNKIKKELEASINSIYVDGNYRNIGIGTSLINNFIDDVKKENVKYIYIDNLLDNNIARYLYNKLGFYVFKETRKMELGN